MPKPSIASQPRPRAVFVCLSSGARPRYRRDIIRVMAMPSGTWIQFRYDSGWVEAGLLNDLTDRKTLRKRRGTNALICYVDQTDPQRDPELLPCRMATLVDAVPLGRTVSLQLELADFAFAANTADFNAELASMAAKLLPRREADAYRGSYWFEIQGNLQTIAQSSDLATWEAIVEQLAVRPDFQQERFYYCVEGVIEIGPDRRIDAANNKYQLRPNREYDVRIYHFHPTEGDPQSLLGLETSHAALAFATNPSMLLDSRYDLKRVRLRTMSPVAAEPGILAMRRQAEGHSEWEWEFDLPFRLRGTFWRKFGLGVLIGIFLAVSPIVGAYSNPNLTSSSRLVISLVAGVSGILAGLAAAFGLRRSL